MGNSITLKTIEKFQKKYQSDNHVKVVRNAMIRTDLSDLTMNWEHYRNINHSFSNIVKGEMPVTNQKSSGRCWGFAGLNLFRFYIGRLNFIKVYTNRLFSFVTIYSTLRYIFRCIAEETW